MSDTKQKDKNEHVVIAIFPTQADAESAINGLKKWDGANDEVKLGTIGTISMEKGKIKTHVGHKTGKGLGVGATVGIIAGVLSGGLTLLAGAAAGAVGGGAVGAFMKQSLHMTKQEIEALGPELESGKVALVVTCDEYELAPTQEWLSDAGGTVRGYSVPSAALAAAVEAGVGADVPVVETPEPLAESVVAASAEAVEPVAEATGPETATAESGTDTLDGAGEAPADEAKPV